ncbi:BnaC01g38610D [Brassica napus]|nr:aspartic proteinase NANA, chloroplast [Brassica napus]CAF2079459.1 unnamed protein product [Brassica napus]CDY52671.1 BnaC01g38610D [Brassica napus]
MKRTRAALLCLLTTLLLISAAYSTVMRLEMTHRDTLFPTSFCRIEDIIGSDQKRHSLISHKRTTTKTNGGARLTLRSGFDYGAAQYFAEIRVGTPAKRFRVVVDTGSELTWVNCRFRGKGKTENRRVFRAEESSSFSRIGCLTQTCKVDLMNLFSLSSCPTPSTPCAYDYRYVDGSAAQGVFGKETFTVRLTNGRVARLPGVLVGCTNSFSGDSFRGADGVLGLALSDYSFTSKATNVFGGKFSYCLVDHLSNKNVSNYLIFGSSSFSSATKLNATRTTPLDLNVIPPFYAINIIGLSLGETMLNIPMQVWDATQGGGTILDSGTSLTFLADAAYKAVVSGLQRYLFGLKRVKPEGLPIEYCFDTTSGFNQSKLPQLTFHFKGGARFEPHRRSYLIDAASGVKCLGFVSAGEPGTNVIGNIMQQNYLWEFDIVASTLTFAPSTCL